MIKAPDGGPPRYSLDGPASGLEARDNDGLLASSLSVAVRVSREVDGQTSEWTYAVGLTTEGATARSADGATSVEITGMKLIEGANAGVTNHPKAAYAAGKPVTVVLSGTFDKSPVLPAK